MPKDPIYEDIATIKEKIVNLSKSFDEFKNDQKTIITRVDCLENKQIAIDIKQSNLTIFQSAFSIVIGAIATYLGANRR